MRHPLPLHLLLCLIHLKSWYSLCLFLPVPEWLFRSASATKAVATVDLLLLQLQQALLGPLQTFQVFHQSSQVTAGPPLLDVGEPASTQCHKDGHPQNQILPLVMLSC